MTRLMAVLLLLLSASSRPAPPVEEARSPNRLTPNETTAGFRTIFNGTDLASWVHNGKPGTFTVKDGVITGDRTDHKELAYWLSTDREYGDFELRLQYRIVKDGNSGIFIRAPREGRASKVGMEIQLVDDGQRKKKPSVTSTAATTRPIPMRVRFTIASSCPSGANRHRTVLADLQFYNDVLFSYTAAA